VRFARGLGGAKVPLVDIPPRVLAEVMRDVALLVGVASVGNDPTWQDGGPAQFRPCWEEFSFGDLSALARTRRVVLERLLPRHAIGPRCALIDRFLEVRGDHRTYQIHLGSGNILMRPNNQYLCVVPKRGGRDGADAGVLLPFEGDTQLSLILSKAFLLAADTAITGPTIVRQIGGP